MSRFINRILLKIRAQFLAGLIIIVPLVLSIFVIWFLFIKLDNILAPILHKYLGDYYVKGLGFFVLLFLIWLIGVLGKNYFGRQIIYLYETIISKIPILNTVFSSIKQISDNLLSKKSKSFKKVVLVRFPFYGVYAIGFLTSSEVSKLEVNYTKEEVVHVFMPTTPNPTSGFLMLVPKKNITLLNIPVEEALKVVIAMGVVHPKIYKSKQIKKGKNKKYGNKKRMVRTKRI